MTESAIIQLAVQVVTVIVAVAGVAWRVGGALRAVSARLDVLAVHLEHSGQAQTSLARTVDAAETRSLSALEAARGARREIWQEVNWLRDRLTRVEALAGAPPPPKPAREG